MTFPLIGYQAGWRHCVYVCAVSHFPQLNCVGEQEKVTLIYLAVLYTQTHLLWIPDICTLQFYHMFEASHKNTHHIKWDFDQGEVFNTFLHQIACWERSL